MINLHIMSGDTNNRRERPGDILKFKENDTIGVSIEFNNNNEDYKYVLRFFEELKTIN